MVMAKLFDTVETKLKEIEVNEKPDTLKNGAAKRLGKKLTKIDAAISRANRRFLSAGDLSEEMESDFRRLVETYQAERLVVEIEIRRVTMTAEEQSMVTDEFSRLKEMYVLSFGKGDPLFEQFDQIRQKRFGDIPFADAELQLPLCSADNLRAFLKKLGARVYVYWQPRALKDKRGNIRLDENGEIARSIRNFEVDHARITAEFRPEDVLSCGNSTSSRADSLGRD